MQTTRAEENYLKAIFHHSKSEEIKSLPNSIAKRLNIKPSSVVDMLKKLVLKKLITYSRKQGAKLTTSGKQKAIAIVRSHRLWEVFLVDKLGYSWGEIHHIAEQLEHVKNPKLVDKLDAFLNFPKYDPHGDPIPNKKGNLPTTSKIFLSSLKIGDKCCVIAVQDDDVTFLNYLESLCINIGTNITIIDINKFDDSMSIRIETNKPIFVSRKFTDSLYVK